MNETSPNIKSVIWVLINTFILTNVQMVSDACPMMGHRGFWVFLWVFLRVWRVSRMFYRVL